MRSSPTSTSRLATCGGRFSGVDQWPDLGVHRGRWIAPVSLLVVVITERLGNSIGRPSGNRPNVAEPILAAIAAIGLFLWPFANRETPHIVTLFCLALAVLVQAAWAIHRYTPLASRVREPLLARVRKAVRFGLSYAAFFGVVAIALSLWRGGDGISLPAVLAAYLIGGVLTGIVVGARSESVADWRNALGYSRCLSSVRSDHAAAASDES